MGIKEYLTECKRVLMLTKKPDKNEYKMIVKVTALGLLAIGLLGFLVLMLKQLIVGGFA